MCDEWMPVLRWPMSIEQFHEMPRNAAYKYEYLGGAAHLSPRPKHYHARLDLSGTMPGTFTLGGLSEAMLRRLQTRDWPNLVPLFQGAFHGVQPFASLDEKTLAQAAKKCLERARTGGDGPWIEQASLVAEHEGRLVGAILVTLVPAGDPCDWDSYYWREAPPEGAVARRLGRPHLTWIFVSPWFKGHGLGSRLLDSAARALLELGFTELLSTFLVGNDSSMLWHWRCGFQLLSYPGSMRLMHERWQRAPAQKPEAPAKDETTLR